MKRRAYRLARTQKTRKTASATREAVFRVFRLLVIVPETGIEPVLPHGNGILSAACLPISPLRLKHLLIFTALVFTSIILGQRVAIGAKQLQVSKSVVIVHIIGVVQFQRNALTQPLSQAAAFAFCFFQPKFYQTVTEPESRCVRRVFY